MIHIFNSVLGAFSTLVASYLARARGSGEPDLSALRVSDLDHFLRTAEAFQLDHGHEHPNSVNRLGEEVTHMRHQLEELLGNASGYVVIECCNVSLVSLTAFLKGEETLACWRRSHSDFTGVRGHLFVSFFLGIKLHLTCPLC